MKKRNILTVILDSIFLVSFNVIFFVCGTTYPPATWICYGFLHFAYLMVLLVPVIEAKGKTSYLSSVTTYAVSLVYFLIEFLFGIFIFTLAVDKTKLADLIQNIVPFYSVSLATVVGNGITVFSEVSDFVAKIDTTKFVTIVQGILTTIYIIVFISNLLANDTIAAKQAEHDAQNDFIKTVSAKAKYIETITNDAELKNKINNLYYSLHSSPIKTSNEVTVYESKITELLEDLECLVEKDSVAASEKILVIEQMLNKRNFMLKSKY